MGSRGITIFLFRKIRLSVSSFLFMRLKTKKLNGQRYRSYLNNKTLNPTGQANNVDRGNFFLNVRWLNHLRPSLAKNEDLDHIDLQQLFRLIRVYGKKWSIIAK